MLTKQAHVLSEKQVAALVRFVETETRYPTRNKVVVLLSFKAGLRAKEIALLKWAMVTDAEGALTSELRLPNSASKGRSSGRVIPLHSTLRAAVVDLYNERTRSAGAPPRANEYILAFQTTGGTESTRRSKRPLFVWRVVSGPRLRRRDIAFGATHVHYIGRQEDNDGGRQPARRTTLGRTLVAADDGAVHRVRQRCGRKTHARHLKFTPRKRR